MTATSPQPPLHVLVTGAASDLGDAVCRALAAAGRTVRATDRSAPRPNAPADFQLGALTDPERVQALLDGVQAVIHLAPLTRVQPAAAEDAGRPGELLDETARGTFTLVKGVVEAGIELMVQASTLSVMDAYDDSLEVTEQWRPRPTPAPAQLAPYLSELAAREFTRDVQIERPPRIVCLRFGALVAGTPDSREDPRALGLIDAARAVILALAALQQGARQRGHRWQLYHIAAPSPYARYTSAAAEKALGYGVQEVAPAGQQERRR